MNDQPFELVRIPSLKTVDEFRAHLAKLRIDLPCDDKIETGPASPLAWPVKGILVNGKQITNRFAIHPMEGWDGTRTGGVTEDVVRRWRRFGQSGSKLIFGGEAMAVRPDGRANPNQLIINEENKAGLAALRRELIEAHRGLYGETSDLVVGFQLTHSGRFCRPEGTWAPRVAYRHPILDKKFNVTSDSQVLSDDEVGQLIRDFVAAARIAREIGADFVDIKHCHGYLLHEFLSAFTRPGPYGGSFENRTRILREIVSGIRADGNPIDLAVRLSGFDSVPFKPDASRAQPGRLGPGIPEEFPLPYPYAFGANPNNPLEIDLTETFQFIDLCSSLGVKILNLTAGSPYYNPHIQRPAAYPPSDGYQLARDPMIEVARQIHAVRQCKARAPGNMIIVGTAYTYLQEYLPMVAQAVIRQGWTDMIGLGRMVLSYPEVLADAIRTGSITPKHLCRTFSDCTTAPRNGLRSGCYPLDKYYSDKPDFLKLKEVKNAIRR